MTTIITSRGLVLHQSSSSTSQNGKVCTSGGMERFFTFTSSLVTVMHTTRFTKFELELATSVVGMLSCPSQMNQLHPVLACLQVTLGKDQVNLKDTKYKFVRINGDMESEVDLELDDPKLVVSRFGIRVVKQEGQH